MGKKSGVYWRNGGQVGIFQLDTGIEQKKEYGKDGYGGNQLSGQQLKPDIDVIQARKLS